MTETMGNFGLEEGLLGSIIDARSRLLSQAGSIIPQALELFVVPVELSEFYRSIDIWTSGLYGLNFASIRPHAMNNFYYVRLDGPTLLGEAASLVRLDLARVATPYVSGETVLTAARRGTMHGIGGWFVARLSEHVLLSNGPPLRTPSWNQIFFPLERPIAVEAGDRFWVAIASNDGVVWRWQVRPEGESGAGPSDQSTFWGFPASAHMLAARAPSHVPSLSRKGEAELFILTAFEGRQSIGEIEAQLGERFPDLFKSRAEASAFIREIVRRLA